MPREYDTFVDDLSFLKEGEETRMFVRELTPDHPNRKYNYLYVKARIFSSQASPNPCDTLWARFQRGQLHPTPFRLQIIEVLETPT